MKETLILKHGTDVIFDDFDSEKTEECTMYSGLGYFGDDETAKCFGENINEYQLEFDTDEFKYKECSGYNYETYKFLMSLVRGDHGYDIVKVPLAMSEPFADWVFDNIMAYDAPSDTLENNLKEVLKCHKNHQYPEDFIKAFDLEEGCTLEEDNLYEVVIFNEELIKRLKFIGRKQIA